MNFFYVSRAYAAIVFILINIISCTKASDHVPSNPGGTNDKPGESNAIVYTIAGKAGDHGNAEDGNGSNARLWNPTKMVYDDRNSTLYVADGTVIRSIDQQNNVKTYMPLGTISNYSEILDLDRAPGWAGGNLYFTTKENDLIKIEPNGNSFKITKLADRIYAGNATGPLNTVDHFDLTNGIATGSNGEIYFFNTSWNTMHEIFNGTVVSFAGKSTGTRGGNAWPFKDGLGEDASFAGSVSDIASDANGNIYVADFRNDLVRMVTPAGNVTSLFQYKDGLGIDKDGPVSQAQANRVTQVTANQDGSIVFFTTYGEGGNGLPSLRMVRPGKEVTTVVGFSKTYGDGPAKSAGLATIGGIATTPDGKTVYISEPPKKVIRKVILQ